MHHIYGPSTLWRRRGCPGSAREEKGLPEQDSEFAQMGHVGHRLVSEAILAWKCGEEPEVFGDDEDEIHVLAKKCFDHFLELVRSIEAREPPRCKETHRVRPSNVWTEILLPLNVPGHGIIYGTCDVLIVHSSGIYILDWKFGWIEFDHDAAAWQVMGYGEAALDQAPVGVHLQAHCELYNPRLDAVADCVFGKADGAIDMIKEVIDDCEAEDAPLQPGDWCRYCKALGLCEMTRGEMRDLILQVAPEEVIRGESKDRIKASIRDYVKQLPADRLLEALNVLPRVEAAVELTRSRAKELLKHEPDSLPGWRLLEKGGRRTADMTKAFDATSGVLEEEEFWSCCSVNVAELERRFAAKFNKAAEGKRQFKATTEEVVTQPKVIELRRTKKTDG